jgi:hypothetical protein
MANNSEEGQGSQRAVMPVMMMMMMMISFLNFLTEDEKTKGSGLNLISEYKEI